MLKNLIATASSLLLLTPSLNNNNTSRYTYYSILLQDCVVTKADDLHSLLNKAHRKDQRERKRDRETESTHTHI